MDLLSDVLSHMRLTGTLYFRTSFTSPWSVRVPAFEQVARFHFAHRGGCLVRIRPDEEPVQLEQGDLIIITRGAAHTLYCDPSTEEPASLLDTVVEDSGFTGHGTLIYGEPGTNQETQLVCGHFAFDENASHPLIDALPEHIHITNYGESVGNWMENTLRVIGAEAGRDDLGSDLIANRLSEIIFAQALRSYLNAGHRVPSRLGGFTDRRLAKSLQAIHQAPGQAWSLEQLARVAGLSRTAFATTFSRLMETTPLAYLTQWRMQIARKLLLESRAPIIDIAEQVGYRSEAAFGRVFKKHFEVPPASYRRLYAQEYLGSE